MPSSTPTRQSDTGPTPAESLTGDVIVRLCRTGVGDSLRSVIHFTPDEQELLYLRRDLYGNDRRRALEVKASLVEAERTALDLEGWDGPDEGTSPVGDYEFTARVFGDGSVCRVAVGAHGVLLTTDDHDLSGVEEVAVAIRRLLATYPTR